MALVRNCIKGWELHPRHVVGVPDFWFATKAVRSSSMAVSGTAAKIVYECQSRIGHIGKPRSLEMSRVVVKSIARSRRVALGC